MAEPCILAFGIVSGGLGALGDGGGQIGGAGEMGGDFCDSDGAHHGEGGVETAGEQGAHFFERAAGDHLGEAAVAAVIEPGPIGQEDERGEGDRVADAAGELLLPMGEGMAGGEDDL